MGVVIVVKSNRRFLDITVDTLEDDDAEELDEEAAKAESHHTTLCSRTAGGSPPVRQAKLYWQRRFRRVRVIIPNAEAVADDADETAEFQCVSANRMHQN